MFNRSYVPVQRMLMMAALALPLWAAAQEDLGITEEAREPAETRKRPGLLTRTAKDTPEAQLAYADTLRDEGQTRRAKKAYAALVAVWHGSAEAPAAQLAYARLQEDAGRYVRAFDEYQYLVDHFAGRFPYQDVIDRQFRIANVIMTKRWGAVWPLPGFLAPERALPLFETLVRNAPGGDRAAECQFTVGLIHEQGHDLDDAARAYEAVRTRYPARAQAEEAAFRQAFCRYDLARKSPRDDARCREALSALAAFLRDYPDSANSAEARRGRDALHARWVAMAYEQAVFYDRIARKPKAALIAYSDFVQKFPLTEQAKEAKERIAILTSQVEDTENDEPAPER